jgi:hypothetical protein
MENIQKFDGVQFVKRFVGAKAFEMIVRVTKFLFALVVVAVSRLPLRSCAVNNALFDVDILGAPTMALGFFVIGSPNVKSGEQRERSIKDQLCHCAGLIEILEERERDEGAAIVSGGSFMVLGVDVHVSRTCSRKGQGQARRRGQRRIL